MDNTKGHKVIVVQFITVDGVIGDPDGSWGEPGGGWALRHGAQVFAGDKFRLARVMDDGALVFGRGTWERFAERWPNRTGEFPDAMNRARKYVVSNTLTDVGAWSNSHLLTGDVRDSIERVRSDGDVAVVGSAPLAQALIGLGLVDELRLLVMPDVVGEGTRLFDHAPKANLRLIGHESHDPGVLLTYEVAPSN